MRAATARSVGSSPLARGLLSLVSELPDRVRIIPARAGFTGGQYIVGLVGRDHPRSRGVYRCNRRKEASCTGSSPLARGLPVPDHLVQDQEGIIPARAGFTPGRESQTTVCADHPRSRGVYSKGYPARTRNAGSSPLARGLPAAGAARGHEGGIIPARAGFTPFTLTGFSTTTDHPRSRGVYPGTGRSRRGGRGSSPLARGLLVSLVSELPDAGIIPARAGFTPAALRRRQQRGDHPRSRGVYLSFTIYSHRLTGSSPLARGLRPDAVRSRAVGGIIPARAGFTGADHRRPARRPDHPRSRGVYPRSDSPSTAPTGSSPLARGLRRGRHDYRQRRRIIPARAGFTRSPPPGAVSRGDHPRSRGVYFLPSGLVGRERGSSPLARGLRRDVSLENERDRIIPARAGFTLTAHKLTLAISDHPRSRGVYRPGH